MSAQISLDSRIVIKPEHISADVGDETIIFDSTEGMYYGLGAVGARIWQLLAEPRTLSQVIDTLLEEYDVDQELCERDLQRLVEDLLGRGLVELVPEGQ